MKIAIDFERGISEFKTGVNWYTYYLVNALAEIDDENSYILYGFKSSEFKRKLEKFKATVPVKKNFEMRLKRMHSGIAGKCCEKFLPIEFLIGKSDVVHLPNTGAVRTAGARVIVTIHDIFYSLPESKGWIPENRRARAPVKTKTAISMADRIITVSEYSKNDIVKHFSVNPGKISVTHLGADDIFQPCKDGEKGKAALEKYGISKKYIFFTGSIYPRKNLVRLVLAFEKAKKRFKEYQLVIAGRQKGFTYNDFFDALKKLPAGVRDDVILAGYVPAENLPYLYSNAALYAYPSLYEGFGLPILEAMSCGCPVLTSNITSMPEVAGDAAVLVNPYSVEEISSGIEKILSDEKLQADMREKGLARAKEFSWEKTAKETLKVYEEVFSQK